MSVIKGCSFAVRVSTDPVIPMPTKKEKEERLEDAEKKTNNKKTPAAQVCVLQTHSPLSVVPCAPCPWTRWNVYILMFYHIFDSLSYILWVLKKTWHSCQDMLHKAVLIRYKKRRQSNWILTDKFNIVNVIFSLVTLRRWYLLHSFVRGTLSNNVNLKCNI